MDNVHTNDFSPLNKNMSCHLCEVISCLLVFVCAYDSGWCSPAMCSSVLPLVFCVGTFWISLVGSTLPLGYLMLFLACAKDCGWLDEGYTWCIPQNMNIPLSKDFPNWDSLQRCLMPWQLMYTAFQLRSTQHFPNWKCKSYVNQKLRPTILVTYFQSETENEKTEGVVYFFLQRFDWI